MLPKPLQDPMPVWVAATSPDALDWAGEQGFSIMMYPHASHGEIAEKRLRYKTALDSVGYSIDGRDIPMARTLAMGETQREAEDIGWRGAEFMFSTYLRKKSSFRGAAAGAQKTVQMDALDQSLLSNVDPVAATFRKWRFAARRRRSSTISRRCGKPCRSTI